MKIARFAIAGSINALLTYLVYVVLVTFGAHYQMALIIDYVFGTITGYLINRYWTFADQQQYGTSFLKYIATYILIYFINRILLSFLVEVILMDPRIGQFIVFLVIGLLSYLSQRNWVFKDKKITNA